MDPAKALDQLVAEALDLAHIERLAAADALATAVEVLDTCGHHLIDGDPPCEHWRAVVDALAAYRALAPGEGGTS